MKIISSFRDYYDSAQAYGHDDSRTYHRERREARYATNVWPYAGEILQKMEALPKASHHGPGFLFFCGEAWPVWREIRYDSRGSFDDNLERTRTFLQWDRYYSDLRDLPKGDPVRKQRAEEITAFFDEWLELYLGRKDMEKAHRSMEGIRLGEDLLIGERAPCALVLAQYAWWHSSSPCEILVVSNPVLKDLDFQRIRDAFSAYQAIETFLGAQLAPADTAPQRVGSDEVIARQKGFDEMSFRTAAPGAKKQHRKENRAQKRR